MTNTTEMPEKIWVNNNKFNDHSNGQGVWFNEKVEDDEVSYTRTDTIPSKAEVAREMFNEAEERYETGNYLSMSDAIEAVLKEWEDAESK